MAGSRVTRRRILLLVGLVLAISLVVWRVRAPERVVFRGGSVVTLDADDRVVEAVGIEGERIRAVGSEAEVLRWAGKGARQVDLRGGALLPGFIDAHGHYPGAGVYAVLLDLNSPPIGEVRAIRDIIERLTARATQTGEGDWIIGMGYDDTLLEERRHPTRGELDTASEKHPIAIWHISGHLAAVNSVALAQLGFDAGTPDPVGGRIRRDAATGEPDGVLEENATRALEGKLLAPGPLDALRVVRRANELYLAAGVTTAQNGYATADHLNGLRWLARLRLLPLRVVIWPGGEAIDALLTGRIRFRSPDERRIRLGAFKLVADGSIQGYTGYLSQPYHVPPGDDPGFRGYPRIPRDELMARVAQLHEAGRQVAVHGNGDASIDDILDAFEAAQRAHPRSDTRHVLIHAQMARDDQLDRMRDLGVIPSFFSLHTYYWGDRHRDIFMGPERAARMSPARSAAERGIRFTLHADSPVVPMEALRLVWAAVNRRSTSGAVIGAAERIDVMRALRAVTIDAAYQHFEEDEKGSLEAGKLADLVVLDRSPLDDPAGIDRIRVRETWVGGRRAHLSPEADSG
jgi:predicted amidohydrolase YtcJ